MDSLGNAGGLSLICWAPLEELRGTVHTFRRGATRSALLLLLVTVVACGGSDSSRANAPVNRDQAVSFQTDTTRYVLDRDATGWGTQISWSFQNISPDTVYAVNCNGATTIAVERREAGGWEVHWAPLTNACLSPPVAIPPGETLSGRLDLWGAPPGGNVGPEFRDTTFSGVYRLAWWNLVHHYDPAKPGFGDTVAVRHRVSNEFALRRR